ncbi:MAG: hypothetical protein WCX27_01185 [Candidatus Paceibacterota bacterium]|jgi:hypothetical protein
MSAAKKKIVKPKKVANKTKKVAVSKAAKQLKVPVAPLPKKPVMATFKSVIIRTLVPKNLLPKSLLKLLKEAFKAPSTAKGGKMIMKSEGGLGAAKLLGDLSSCKYAVTDVTVVKHFSDPNKVVVYLYLDLGTKPNKKLDDLGGIVMKDLFARKLWRAEAYSNPFFKNGKETSDCALSINMIVDTLFNSGKTIMMQKGGRTVPISLSTPWKCMRFGNGRIVLV